MGSFPSTVNHQRKYALKATQAFSNNKEESVVPLYMPASFPLQNLRASDIIRIRDSWREISAGAAAGILTASSCGGKTGIVIFQDEFYSRLFTKAEILQDYITGLKTKGVILSRVITTLCSLNLSKERTLKTKLKKLGKWHANKNIHPWMLSVFAETLVETVMFCFGPAATVDLFEAWALAMVFCLQPMIAAELLTETIENNRLCHLRRCSCDRLQSVTEKPAIESASCPVSGSTMIVEDRSQSSLAALKSMSMMELTQSIT